MQIAVRQVASEPYPGLYQPSFGGVLQSGREATTWETEVTLEFADGTTRATSVEEVLPPTGVLPRYVFASGFGDQQSADDPRTVAWLRDRLAVLDEREAAAMEVRWIQAGYSLVDGSRRVLQDDQPVRVDLQDEGGSTP